MTLDEYQNESLKAWVSRPISLVHDAMALAEEASECLQPVRRATFYNQALDFEHLAEELSQTLWCLARFAANAGMSLEQLATQSLAIVADKERREPYGPKELQLPWSELPVNPPKPKP